MSKPARYPADNLLEVHAAGLAPAANPRSDDEISFTGANGLCQPWNELRAIAAIAIQEDDDLALFVQRGDARQTGAAIASPRLDDHPGPGLPRPLGRAVGAAVVDDQYFVGDGPWNRADDIADRLFLVEGGNDDRNLGYRAASAVPVAEGIGSLAYRLHLRPQLAQALGGWGDSSAWRNS